MVDRTIKVQPDFGMFWFMGWLFALGYLHLGFWKGVLAIVLWPYFLGVGFAG